MPHMRQQIRDHVGAGLTGLPTTGSNVHVGRTRPLAKGHAPALLVYMRRETARRDSHGRPPRLERACTLFVEGRVQQAGVPDDALDAIAGEVEAGVAALIDYGRSIFFGGLARNVEFVGTELIADAEGEQHIGGVRLEYLVTYTTAEGAPGAVG